MEIEADFSSEARKNIQGHASLLAESSKDHTEAKDNLVYLPKNLSSSQLKPLHVGDKYCMQDHCWDTVL